MELISWFKGLGLFLPLEKYVFSKDFDLHRRLEIHVALDLLLFLEETCLPVSSKTLTSVIPMKEFRSPQFKCTSNKASKILKEVSDHPLRVQVEVFLSHLCQNWNSGKFESWVSYCCDKKFFKTDISPFLNQLEAYGRLVRGTKYWQLAWEYPALAKFYGVKIWE